MPEEVIVPEVGEVGMDITFLRWLKEEGEEVSEGEDLFEVDTGKSVIEVEAFASGTLADCRVREGDSVQPQQIIALLLRDGERWEGRAVDDEGEPCEDGEPTSARQPGAAASARTLGAPEGSAAGAGATPGAKGLARERGVTLDTVTGTGRDGLITKSDVEAAASVELDGGATQLPGSDVPSDRARAAVASRTQRTWQTVPHFHIDTEIDVSAVLDEVRPTTLVCAAAARALARHPECNVRWTGEGVEARESVDLGLLVDSPTGLVIGRVAGADRLALEQLDEALRALVERARAGELTADDHGPRSMTISNLGMFAVDRFSGVLASPDALLLSSGRIRTVPRRHGEAWIPRQALDLVLTVDHRVLDGASGGRLLTTLERLLSDPEVLREDA